MASDQQERWQPAIMARQQRELVQQHTIANQQVADCWPPICWSKAVLEHHKAVVKDELRKSWSKGQGTLTQKSAS